MDSESLWRGIGQVLSLLKQHSEKHRRPRPSPTKLERLSGWTVLIGGLMYFAGEVLRQVGHQTLPSWRLADFVLSLLGLILFSAGGVGILIDFARTTRRPFQEHLDNIIAAGDREYEVIGALLRFDAVTLELTGERLSLESTKVSSRLGMIGGGEGLKTSLVGVVTLAAALFSQYEPAIHGLTMKTLAFFGIALLVGLSIGGLRVRYGASEAEYYRGLIRVALLLKAHSEKKLREPFARRMVTKRRDGK